MTVYRYLQVALLFDVSLTVILFIVIGFISALSNYSARSLKAGTVSLYLSKCWDMFSFS